MNYSRARGRKNVKKGVSFTLMVVGASGTGRTTFVNTLCDKKVLDHKYSDDPANAHLDQTVSIRAHQVGASLLSSAMMSIDPYRTRRGRGANRIDCCRYSRVRRCNRQ